MPRVCINKKEYKVENIGSWVVSRLFKARKSQRILAAELGISQQLLSYRLRHNIVTYADLLTFIDFFKLTDDEIIDLLRL